MFNVYNTDYAAEFILFMQSHFPQSFLYSRHTIVCRDTSTEHSRLPCKIWFFAPPLGNLHVVVHAMNHAGGGGCKIWLAAYPMGHLFVAFSLLSWSVSSEICRAGPPLASFMLWSMLLPDYIAYNIWVWHYIAWNIWVVGHPLGLLYVGSTGIPC